MKRQLSAVKYPQVDVNVNDEKQFRTLIAWLEENKIQLYTPENRKHILNTKVPGWTAVYDKYKKDLSCPFEGKPQQELAWILGQAVEKEYSGKRDIYEKFAVENLKTSTVPNVIAENPLDKLDFNSQEFKEGINSIAKLLKISPHPDSLITLRAVSKVICKRLTSHALKNPNEYILKGTPFPLKDADLGFDLGDPLSNIAAKVLRVLYIHSLRELQTKANELIVSVQNITADPKTDTKLGKVGK